MENLFNAARAGDSGALAELLTHGANANMKNQVLSQFGYVVSLLVSVNLGIVNEQGGETALMIAARNGCCECAITLVAHGADVNYLQSV